MKNRSVETIFVITGTSRGVGKYLAEYYVEKGNVVIGCSRGESSINRDKYHHFQIDVSDRKSVSLLFQYVRREFGRLDVTINNAAINPAIVGAALTPDETLRAVFDVNVLAVMSICRESVKIMARRRWGRIINIGSMATKLYMPGESTYTSAKEAVNAYTRVLSKEVFGVGITANVVAPSIVDTQLSRQIDREKIQRVLDMQAIKTFGQMADISNTIDFLLLPTSSAVTGQVLYLGGL